MTQACNYAENVLFYKCFSKNMAKTDRTAILMNFFCMQSKSQWSTHLVFFKPLILVVKKEIHTKINLEVSVEGLVYYV